MSNQVFVLLKVDLVSVRMYVVHLYVRMYVLRGVRAWNGMEAWSGNVT